MAVVFLLGCSGPDRSTANIPSPVIPLASQADENGTILFSLGGEPSVLNPVLSLDTSSSAVEGPIFNGLIKFNSSLEAIPDLAERWDISRDGKVWTFYLKKNVFWHDGQPFTSADVKFTFDAILNPKVNSVRRSDYMIDGQPIEFIAQSKYVFQAVLPKPFAPFLTHMAMGIIPEHALAGKDINTAEFNRNPIGTGPFKFVEWHSGDYLKLARNEKYFAGKPMLSQIIYKIIPDENTSLLALESGEIDESGIPAKDLNRMLKVKHLNVFAYDSLLYTYLGLNLDRPIFQDKRVRQALAFATDKNQLISLIFKGMAEPAFCPSAPVSWAYSDDVEKYPYNMNKAKALLEEAGWKLADNYYQKDGKPFEFTVLTNQGNKDREKAAVILQQQYKKVGIKMNIRVMEWSSLLKIIDSPRPPKDFDAVIIGWSLGLDPDDYSIWHSSQYPAGFNFIKYVNPEVDRLLEEGRTTMQRDERKKIYARLNRIISEDQPYIFLWYPKVIDGIDRRVGGLSKPGPAGMMVDIEKVFVTRGK